MEDFAPGCQLMGQFKSAYFMQTNCYIHIASVGSKQRGDAIVLTNSGGLCHVGIVSDGNLTLELEIKQSMRKQFSLPNPQQFGDTNL